MIFYIDSILNLLVQKKAKKLKIHLLIPLDIYHTQSPVYSVRMSYVVV